MRISVVTPTRNAARYLRSCMDSVAMQSSTGLEVEHIIVDAGSTDGTLAIVEQYNCKLVHSQDRSVFEAINIGNDHATGDLLGVLGADDTLTPGALAIIAACATRMDTEMVVGHLRWVDGNGRSQGKLRHPPPWMNAEMLASLEWNCMHHPSTYVTKSLSHRLAEFNQSYRYSSDYDYFVRALRTTSFRTVQRVVAVATRNGQNLSMAPDPLRQRENQQIVEQYAPQTLARRLAYRWLLKAYFNGTSPMWFLQKQTSKLRLRGAEAS